MSAMEDPNCLTIRILYPAESLMKPANGFIQEPTDCHTLPSIGRHNLYKIQAIILITRYFSKSKAPTPASKETLSQGNETGSLMFFIKDNISQLLG